MTGFDFSRRADCSDSLTINLALKANYEKDKFTKFSNLAITKKSKLILTNPL